MPALLIDPKCDLTNLRNENEFPEELNNYIAWIEEELRVPIRIISVGPDREQTIVRYRD